MTPHTPQHTSLKAGRILIASPMLMDPNFRRTIILILDEDSQQGHIGLILNRPLSIDMHHVCGLEGAAGQLPLYDGGPVDLQRLFCLHTQGHNIQGAVEILPGLYVGGNYEEAIQTASSQTNLPNHYRFLLGYSGWSTGQLEQETAQGAWATTSVADPTMLLRLNPEEAWTEMVRQLGPAYRHWLLLPPDAALN